MSRGAPRSTRFPMGLERLQGEVANASPRDTLRPQRLLREAALDATRLGRPTGIGLDSAWVRKRMVDRLRAEGLCGEPVLAAMEAVERHRFIDSALVAQAYEDTSLPIGHGQTISKPSVIARMIGLLFEGESARAQGHLGRVLEIGTGCGYQAAVLCQLSRDVVSIERLGALAERARSHLHDLIGRHLHVQHGDGMLGFATRGPYQSIIAAAGGDALPEAWLLQLAPGGRLVAPMRQCGTDGQVLTVVDKLADGSTRQRMHDGVLFVPLESGTM